MKPTISDLQALCPDVPLATIAEHLERLAPAYFKVFTSHDVARHLRAIARLGPEQPVQALTRNLPDGMLSCTVVAFDHPGEFALITGALSSAGYDIASGDVFTYAPAGSARRRIIDHFTGTCRVSADTGVWRKGIEQTLNKLVGLLEAGGANGASEARRLVNEMAARRLGTISMARQPVLYPMDIEIDNTGSLTRLIVRSQDTPMFLYALSGALSMQGLVIEHVVIRTIAGRIEDEIELSDARGAKITNTDFLDRLKLTVLITKQFTYFAGSAPDPYAALCRFDQLLEHVLGAPERGMWLDLFSNPERLRDLARLLGASDYLWEDFIRLQYENLLPLLTPRQEGGAACALLAPERDLPEVIDAAGSSFAAKVEALNAFKDREIFRIDFEHILATQPDASALAEPLTRLAESVVITAVNMLYHELVSRHGVPRTVAGLEAEWALMGLGKFGGVAMGYASDIELLFVFSDNGRTDGDDPLDNLEFFDRLMRRLPEIVRAPREGIFRIDLRLRPYGSSGPAACSLASFCRYYGTGGQAHSYERLALVRMRAVGGSPALGARIERLRDEFLYTGSSVSLEELRDLRRKQMLDKVAQGPQNAKFSPGSLVDLEYTVQMLQVMCGRASIALRTPRIREALKALSELGVISAGEAASLTEAYYFMRSLVNALRMFRGSAKDLFLPPPGSMEFAHLARRMGYRHGADLEPEQQLQLDFKTRTAYVRAFIERHFGRDSLPGAGAGNIADLALSDSLPENERNRILSDAGFKNATRAYFNLRALAGNNPERRERFAGLAVLAGDFLKDSPDSDMALNNWERFVQTLPDVSEHFEQMFSQPKRLELLLAVFGVSQFLADTLCRNPDFLDWATDASVLGASRGRMELTRDLQAWSARSASNEERLCVLGRFRKREILRIGTRDLCLLAPVAEITADLSALAEAAVEFCLDHALEGHSASGFCIIALGKLGGRELNYSSDIDLMGFFDPAAGGARELPDARAYWEQVMRRAAQALATHTEEGHAYRVDLRLRPYGEAGALLPSLSALVDYYKNKAALWEVQALLKARPVAGDLQLGQRLIAEINSLLRRPRKRSAVAEAIAGMRETAIKAAEAASNGFMNVKSGRGGIRDVEFLVQALQLMYAREKPELIEANTLAALERLEEAGILQSDTAEKLREDYILLRRVEHFLQIYEDRQVHDLPGTVPELTALGKRVFGPATGAEEFMARLDACLEHVRSQYLAALKINGFPDSCLDPAQE